MMGYETPPARLGLFGAPPAPTDTRVTRLARDGFPATVIVRDWLPGDTRRCRLCRECGADHRRATCTIVAIGLDLTASDAALFDARHLPMDRGGKAVNP